MNLSPRFGLATILWVTLLGTVAELLDATDISNSYEDVGDVDGTIEGPSLTLSCTLCAQFFNITLKMRNSSTKKTIEATIREQHCAGIGVFKKICNQTMDMHYDQVYEESGRMGSDSVKRKCQKIGLCPSRRIPAYCKEYYDAGTPLIPNRFSGESEL